MKLLLDECVDRRRARLLSGHEVRTVAQMGWVGTKNGALLSLAEAEFEVFITVDRNLSFQQNLTGVQLGVVVPHASSNSLESLAGLIPEVLAILPSVVRGRLVQVGT